VRFQVITLFPEMIDAWIRFGLLGRAIESGVIQVSAVSPRVFARDNYRTVDDAPYGGGSGMVMMAEPLAEAINAAEVAAGSNCRPYRLLLTPQGARFTQADAMRLAQKPDLMLICGRSQGVDERARALVDEEVSLGDFVTNGGEVAAVAIVEATARLIPGVLGDSDSLREESHSDGLLQYPHYTRPRVFQGQEGPSILLSGNHAEIAKWRRIQALRRTRQRRPDLFARYTLTEEEREWLVEDDARSDKNSTGNK
jgi:tRNA (guanine37-N1)-methyltransferase